jgi:hypothetical protein
MRQQACNEKRYTQGRARILLSFTRMETRILSRHSLLPDTSPIPRVDRGSAGEQPAGSIVATDDPELIRDWASRHRAEPATGEATESGPATVDVQDGDAGIRFNFPAAGRFRPISWNEWFQNFRQHKLLFVYESDVPGTTPSGRYRIVPEERVPRSSDGGSGLTG